MVEKVADIYLTGKALKESGKAVDDVVDLNKATDNLVGVRAEGDFGKLPPNQQFYEVQTTSGVVIKATEGKTTTVLGTYVGDTRHIIDDQLILAKNIDYTAANNGGFNLLNVPDSMSLNKSADQFWKEINEPFLKAAVERGDEIYLATTPNFQKGGNMYKENGTLTGFGREFEYLTKHGYVYDASSGRMIKK